MSGLSVHKLNYVLICFWSHQIELEREKMSIEGFGKASSLSGSEKDHSEEQEDSLIVKGECGSDNKAATVRNATRSCCLSLVLCLSSN